MRLEGGGASLAGSALPRTRPPGVGPISWAVASIAGRPGVRYAVLLVAVAAGLIGSAALLGHAANAPSLAAYQRDQSCGASGATAPDCRDLRPASVLDDRPLPLGIHAVTVSADARRVTYYGWAQTYYTGVLPASSDALLIDWQGRAARVVGPGLTLEPFEGPPGAGSLLLVGAILCEFVCGLALGLQGVAGRLRTRVLPIAFGRAEGTLVGAPFRLVFLGALVVALLAGRTGHASLAAPLHALCGLVMVPLFGFAGLGSAGALRPFAARGMDGLSEERALGLGADVVLAAVLAALCLSLATDLVVADLLTLPR